MADDIGVDKESFEAGRQERYREFARQSAIRINVIMDSIGAVDTGRYDFYRTDNGYAIENKFMKSICKNVDNLSGFGHRYSNYVEKNNNRMIALIEDDSKEGTIEMDIRESLGIKTPYVLDIGIHTDIKTMSQVEDSLIEHPEYAFFLGTCYYFDENGNFGKAVTLPPGVVDDRPSLKKFEGKNKSFVRYVESEMEPADFELVDFALGVLEEGVKGMQTEK